APTILGGVVQDVQTTRQLIVTLQFPTGVSPRNVVLDLYQNESNFTPLPVATTTWVRRVFITSATIPSDANLSASGTIDVTFVVPSAFDDQTPILATATFPGPGPAPGPEPVPFGTSVFSNSIITTSPLVVNLTADDAVKPIQGSLRAAIIY